MTEEDHVGWLDKQLPQALQWVIMMHCKGIYTYPVNQLTHTFLVDRIGEIKLNVVVLRMALLLCAQDLGDQNEIDGDTIIVITSWIC